MEKTTRKHPVNSYQKRKNNKTIFCFAYQEDLDQAYAFYCSRYKDMSYDEFMNLGITEVIKKISSIPKDEPLYEIIKARSIDIGKIKDKEEKKYWREMKRIHEIPKIYLTDREIDLDLRKAINNAKIGGLK